jgi:hypothetical protein
VLGDCRMMGLTDSGCFGEEDEMRSVSH